MKKKLYCMDTGSFRIYILHKNKRHLCGHCKRFPKVLYTSNYELERPLPEGNIKKLSD